MNAALSRELGRLAQGASEADRDRLTAIAEAFGDADGVAGLPGPAWDFCNDLDKEGRGAATH